MNREKETIRSTHRSRLPMSLDTMRYLDRWAGVFLCFVLSVINTLVKLFLTRKNKGSYIKKILIIKLSEMGTIILSYPFIRFVRDEYPKADIFFLTFKENAPVFDFLNIISRKDVVTIRNESIGLFIVDVFYAIKRLRKEKIDIIFDLELFSRISALLAFTIGGSRKVGFYNYCNEGLYRGNFLTHKVPYNPALHISESFSALYLASKESKNILPCIKRKIDKKRVILPDFIPSSEMKIKIWDKLNIRGIKENDKFVVFNLGNGVIPLREWPLENFISIAKKILVKNYKVIITGTKTACKKSQLFMESFVDSGCIDFSGITTLPEIITLLSLSTLVLTEDCGLAHLGSLVNTKVFVFFGPETPRVYSPLGENTRVFYANLLCSPCFSAFNHRKSACKINQCLKAITADEVYQALEEHL